MGCVPRLVLRLQPVSEPPGKRFHLPSLQRIVLNCVVEISLFALIVAIVCLLTGILIGISCVRLAGRATIGRARIPDARAPLAIRPIVVQAKSGPKVAQRRASGLAQSAVDPTEW